MREQNIIKMIKKALKNDHLYTNEEISYMKKEMHNIENIINDQRKKTSKGFGSK